MTTSTLPATDSQDGSTSISRYDALTDAVRELVKVMRDGGIGQLEVRQGDLRIALKSASFVEAERPHGEVVPIVPAIPVETEEVEDTSGHIVTSPMIGTYYSAPGPNERPFVQLGDRVEAGQTVAIIEAMKIMNEIVAERGGTVAEIYVHNGEAVEYGHRLMRLK